ncbi:MAG: DUF2784 domain-containing protein [Gammaproteobacteria bacterium]|nr:DUF2784 domain-containing protein [Gammaproteobacteria bacterium]NNL99291.1 DUF2784 domain-containing protein [Gammaproteobacteria bacterium]
MDPQARWRLAADALLLVHALFVVFVVIGLLLILLGGARRWRWVRNPWFRAAHLAAIAFVVLQAWLGRICPLTLWENALHARAGDAVYTGSFIARHVEALLYYDAPPWVFTVTYSVFGVLVAAAWWWVRPRPLTTLSAGKRD